MKIIYGLSILLMLSSLMATAIPVNNNDLEAVDAGKRKIIEALSKNIGIKPGLMSIVSLPDINVYKTTGPSGTLYHYRWTTVTYETRCDPRTNCICNHEKEKTATAHISCTATYWIKPWDKEFTPPITGPRCV